jgi:hypothetical protein
MRGGTFKIRHGSFFGAAHPHADQVACQNAVERQTTLAGCSLGKEGLPTTWRSVQKNSISHDPVLTVFPCLSPALNQISDLLLLIFEPSYVRETQLRNFQRYLLQGRTGRATRRGIPGL